MDKMRKTALVRASTSNIHIVYHTKSSFKFIQTEDKLINCEYLMIVEDAVPSRIELVEVEAGVEGGTWETTSLGCI